MTCNFFIDKCKVEPDISIWLKEAKEADSENSNGIYLFSNGVVRSSSKRKVRAGEQGLEPVKSVKVECNYDTLETALRQTSQMPGVNYLRVWVNEGELELGESIMLTLVGADIRDRCVDALTFFVDKLKGDCLTETEIF